jgi:phosphoadenosine phosphosulfate reductase
MENTETKEKSYFCAGKALGNALAPPLLATKATVGEVASDRNQPIFLINPTLFSTMDTTQLNQLVEGKPLEESLAALVAGGLGRVAFSTSFGIEDQVIAHAILAQGLGSIELFTLDTGRLFPETYSVWSRTQERYGAQIRPYYPDHGPLEAFVAQNGINAFYQSVELRQQCCHLRKVEPLQRALQGVQVWVTGLRAEQSANRGGLALVQWDETYQLYKFNPLLHWTMRQVRAYVEANNIIYNPLHDRGFVSIGCQPCTRAVREGEDFRAGRWWWEDQSKKECGLHR